MILPLRSRMKGGFYRLKGNQISFCLLALVCTTILFWAWDKSLLLASLLPPQNRLLHLPPADSKEPEQHHFDPQTLTNSPESTSRTEKAETNVKNASFTGKDGEEITEEEMKMQDAKYSDASAKKEPLDSAPAEEKETPGSIRIKAKPKQVSDGKNISELLGKDSVHPSTSINENSSSREADSKNSAANTLSEECNYAKGKWVEDNSRPLYSGFGCKQWLSAMWACRLTQRTDFAYEKLRWQPKDCSMEEFARPKFLERMRDKTLAFIGDSLGRQQFQSLMCMATGGIESSDVADVGNEYNLIKAHGAVRPDGWAYRFRSTNTTILYYWSASLSYLEPLDSTNPETDLAMHLDRPPWFLEHYIHRFDVLVLNTGHHWNRGKFKGNRWVMHVGGKPNTDMKIAQIHGAKNFTVHSIVSWVNSQLPKYPGLKVFFRSISPRHFFNGDWNTGGTCDNTAVLVDKEVLQDESSDHLAASAVKGTKVKLLDITAMSELRDEGHISRYSNNAMPGVRDCLHWCLPGVPDSWNEILFAQL